MRKEDIREKLFSFYEGNTSEEEERELYVYFSTADDLPEDLEKDKQVFVTLFEDEQDIQMPAMLTTNLERMIDKLGEDESTLSRSPRLAIRRVLWVGGVAACLTLALLIGVDKTGILNSGEVTELEQQDTFSDPEEAYKATEGALLYTSAKMNKVLSHLERDKSGKNKN